MTSIPWEALGSRFDQRFVDALRQHLESSGNVSLVADQLAADTNVPAPEAERLLQELADRGALEVRDTSEASCHECGSYIQESDLVTDECPRCGELLDPDALTWRTRREYVRQAPRGRDVPWVLVVHGMNTRGTWQEQLSWRLATTYGRSVPVYIHKYGAIKIGVMLRWRQRQLVDDLADRIREITGRGDVDHLGRRPDVIAHSFGTWLVGHLLRRHDDIDLGRIVLVGSVLRPDFDWQIMLDDGRTDAVLNHYGARDRWVPLAAWTIPDAGPSGRRAIPGGQRVINREEPEFGHSDFFRDRLREAQEEVWQPFLQHPAAWLSQLDESVETSDWSPPPWILRHALRIAVFLFVTVVASWLIVALALGTMHLVG